MKHHTTFVAVVTLLTWVAFLDVSARGQQLANATSASAVSKVPAPAEPAPGEYVIRADDVLSVLFWKDQTMSGDVVVRPDGKISLPLIDDVNAAGLTAKQLRDRVVSEARRFLSDPVATVVVKQINSRKVYITGMVGRPGQYSLLTGMTVLQVVA